MASSDARAAAGDGADRGALAPDHPLTTDGRGREAGTDHRGHAGEEGEQEADDADALVDPGHADTTGEHGERRHDEEQHAGPRPEARNTRLDVDGAGHEGSGEERDRPLGALWDYSR
mgnify:CR=1 FL=1